MVKGMKRMKCMKKSFAWILEMLFSFLAGILIKKSCMSKLYARTLWQVTLEIVSLIDCGGEYEG